MIPDRKRAAVLSVAVVLLLAAGYVVDRQLLAVGAGGILHPARRPLTVAPPEGCVDASFAGVGVELRGWRCAAAPYERRGTLVFLHGVADNRASGAGVIRRYRPRGFDVVAYDSRAHGESGGDICSYGFFERADLTRVLDTVEGGPVIVIGTSLGAAVALQAAGSDARIAGIVAAETFSDLRTIVAQRAPFFTPARVLDRVLLAVEARGRFVVDEVSPVHLARSITAPVLLIHGDADVDTVPAHSQRVLDALAGRKRLLLVPGATHNGSLQPQVWDEIDRWIEDVI